MRSYNISKRASNIRKSAILDIDLQIKSLEAQKRSVTRLHIGNVWQKTDERIISKAHEAMQAGRTGYEGVGSCIPEFAEALIDYWKRRYDVDIDRDWIITGPSMGLLNQTIDCLLEPGKKIAVLTPAWEVYFSQISETLATEFAIPMKYSAGHWRVSTFSGKGVDLFLTNDPNNPTSSVFDERSRQAIISAASETEAPIICDMAYDNLYWDCDFRPLLKYNEVADRVITFGSFSKSHRMAGWRIGYMLSSNREFLTIMRHKIRKDWTCAPPFTQYAAAYGLSEEFESREREWCATVRRICMKSVEVLRSFGIECTEPKGTIYVFAKVGVDSVDFSNHLIEAHGIATVPGKYFGGNAVDWLRITPLAVPEDELYPALETIGREYEGTLHK